MTGYRRRGSYDMSDTMMATYEAQYLGWKPCETMTFNSSVKSLVEEILRERQVDGAGTNIMHITLTLKELKIVQYLSRLATRSGPKMEKYRFPPIPSNDITFAQQCSPPEVVATIILGYSATSKQYLHVHVFRFNKKEMAANFQSNAMDIVNQLVNKKRLAKIRDDLIEGGHLTPDVARSQSESSHMRSKSTDGQEVALNSLAKELRMKLRPNPSRADPSQANGAPLLLPPRDYDTISRSHGDVIRHRQAIMAEKEALETNQPEMVDSVPNLQNEEGDYDPTMSGSGYESPSSTGSGTPRTTVYDRTRHSHSLGSSDAEHKRYSRRNKIPFRANDSMPTSTWQTHKQN